VAAGVDGGVSVGLTGSGVGGISVGWGAVGSSVGACDSVGTGSGVLACHAADVCVAGCANTASNPSPIIISPHLCRVFM